MCDKIVILQFNRKLITSLRNKRHFCLYLIILVLYRGYENSRNSEYTFSGWVEGVKEVGDVYFSTDGGSVRDFKVLTHLFNIN